RPGAPVGESPLPAERSCSGANWCCPRAMAPARACVRALSMATPRRPTARLRSTRPATPCSRCCLCSMRWPAAMTSPCSTPGPGACCAWSSPMAETAPLRADQVAVVIPALNEELRIRGVVEGALARVPTVIVVDDGSDDATAERIADLPVHLVRHPRRLGKGAARRDGFREAERLGMRAVVTMDGDGQHDPADIPR